VSYEALVGGSGSGPASTEATLRELLSFLGLRWDWDVLDAARATLHARRVGLGPPFLDALALAGRRGAAPQGADAESP
jgi:hypothetical protein